MLTTLFLIATTAVTGPIPQGTGKGNGPTEVQVTTAAGEELVGTIGIKRFSITTDFGSAVVLAGNLEQIEFGSPDVVVTDGGIELRGKVKLSSLTLKMANGRKSLRRAGLSTLAVLRGGRGALGKGFGGDWMGSFGPMKLEQRGIRVKGTFGHAGDGKLEGKVKGSVLTFEYRDSSGSGEGTFELWEDGSSFTGKFGDDRFWGAYRHKPKRAATTPGEITSGQTESGMNYHLRVPKGWQAGQELPAIAFLHGSNMTSKSYVATIAAAWPKLAERYVLVGFDGEKISRGSKPDDRRFNFTYVNFGGPEVGPKWAHRQSPALVAEGLDELKEQLNVTSWFVGGHSQGGFLTYAVMMFYPEKLAGAFPMSCNLLVQCEPDNFDDDKVRKQQRDVAVAVIHGENDSVVEFSSGQYCFRRMIDGGFPAVRFFTDKSAAHMFARLPVEQAVTWLEGMTSGDTKQLVAFAGKELADKRYRSASAAVMRARAGGASATDVAAVEARIDQQAKRSADKLRKAIVVNRNAAWVDGFLDFRREFAFAVAAKECMAAYQKLRDEHAADAEKLFYAARREKSKDERNAKYREILEKYYASKWYELVKGWID